MYPKNDFIHQLKSQINIVDVVGEYVRLKKSGSNQMGLCPFHAERSPSFTVSEKKGIFHCFGCQKNGDAISFIQEIQSVPFQEAVRILCVRYGIKIPPEFTGGKNTTNENREAPVSDVFFKLNRFVAQFYHENLLGPKGQAAREYLYARGITDQTIKQAYLGYATSAWADLYDFLKSKQAPLDKAEELGLIRKKSTGADASGRAHYDLFRERVIFPVVDNRGRIVAFGGRLLGSAEGPKYLNSSDSVIFKKGSQLYGVFFAQKEIRAEDACVVVEGFMDCLSMQQAGIGHCVATLGTALTEEHAAWLKRLTANIIVLFDGDSAGQEAQLRAMETFLKAGLVSRGVSLPDGYDPDEFIREKGVEALKAMLNKAPYLLDQHILDLASKSGFHSESRVQAVDGLIPFLALIRSETARIIRIQEISSLFQISEEALNRKVDEAIVKQPGQKPTQQQGGGARPLIIKRPVSAQKKNAGIDLLDAEFVSKLIQSPSFLNQIEDFESISLGLENQEVASFIEVLLKDLLDQMKEGKTVFSFDSNILENIQSPPLKNLVSKALMAFNEKGIDETKTLELKDLEARLVKRGLEKRRNQLRAVLLKADTSGNSEEFSKLILEYNKLVKLLDGNLLSNRS